MTKQPDTLKLSRSDARKVKKVATGPLLGPINPSPEVVAPAPEVATSIQTIGSVQAIHERIEQVMGGGG